MNTPETRVLVVDDDKELRTLLRRALEGEGHRVVDHGTGTGVLGLLEAARFDAVVLDRELPGVSGLDLLPVLRRRHPDTAVILITSFGGTRIAAEALRRGAAEYLEKPFHMDDLLEAVRRSAPEKGPPLAESA
ncbi:MAG: response regulator [Candidatus Rokuibacteriota bacterium]